MRRAGLVFLVGILGVILPHFAHASGGREPDTRRVSRSFSFGFQDEDDYYFLMEYRVSTPRRPVWFIMPIERSPVVHDHRIFLYRFNAGTGTLERLATVLDEVPRQTSITFTIFGLREGRLVFAFQSGSEPDVGLLYDLRVWDRDAQSLVEDERVVTPRDAPEYDRYFGDYEGGLADYPGMVSISTLRHQILADVSQEQWELPEL